MATSMCRHVLKNRVFKITKPLICAQTNHFQRQSVRSLFNDHILGLEIHQRVRVDVRDKYRTNKDEYFDKMKQNLSSETKKTVFTDDLKAIVTLAETEDEIKTAIDMMKKYACQNLIEFKQSVIGPIAMRMFHILGKPQIAYELFKDKAMGEFFDQMSSYLVLMDMLFEHNMHEKNLDIYDDIQKRFLGGVRFPKDCMTLAICSALKLGTDEAYEKVIGYLEKAKSNGTVVPVRGTVAAALFAIQKNNPEIVISLLEDYDYKKHISVINALAMARVKLGQIDEGVELIGSVRFNDMNKQRNVRQGGTIFSDTLEMAANAVKLANRTDLTHKFEIIKKDLIEHEHINSRTLEQFIFQPIRRYRQAEQTGSQYTRRQNRYKNILSKE